jgi:co-chaperonin GroES (HSP10)
MSYQVLPYTFKETSTQFKRLIVKPHRMAEEILDNGLIAPEHESPLCEAATVIAAEEGGKIKKGDEVFYNKVDRLGDTHLDTVEIDGEICDVIYENEVWCCNEEPIGRIFVEAFSELESTIEGLHIPGDVKSVTQKGRVMKAPAEYKIKPGDLVEFRKQEAGIFTEAVIDGVPLMILYEADVFKVNGKVAPYRIIVKIDMVAQMLKRRTSDSGIHLSELFKFMLYNLQYAVVAEIGEEAAKLYPELNEGDTVIMHHFIESQPYRLVGQEFSKNKHDNGAPNLIYEYRALNCWDKNDGSREIFGKMTFEKKTGKILNIKPYNDSVFLKWDFNMFEAISLPSELLASVQTDITKFHNIDDFRNIVKHNQQLAAEKAKAKITGIRQVLSNIDPEWEKDLFDWHESELKTVQAEETRVSQYLRRNHLLVCKRVFPPAIPSYVVTTYEELYPINILGNKFLIAHQQFIIAQTTQNMDNTSSTLLPLGVYVIVKPIAEERSDDLIAPVTAKETPQRGIVVAISEHDKVKQGDTVLFRKSAGMEQDIQGVPHIILTHNDLIAVVIEEGLSS